MMGELFIYMYCCERERTTPTVCGRIAAPDPLAEWSSVLLDRMNPLKSQNWVKDSTSSNTVGHLF